MSSLKSLHIVSPHFARLQAEHPSWMQQYDDTVFGCETQGDLDALLASAPTDFAAGVIYGKASVIKAITSVTERPLFMSEIRRAPQAVSNDPAVQALIAQFA